MKALGIQKGTILGSCAGGISLNWYLKIIILKNRIREAWNNQEQRQKGARKMLFESKRYFNNEAWE